MSEKRIYKWDNAKFILIVLVVIGHFMQYCTDKQTGNIIFYLVYLFHMPAFIFLSGIFSKSFMRKERIETGKIFALFTLYVLLKISIAFVRVLTTDRGFVFSLFFEEAVPWYLLALGIWYIVTYSIRNVKPVYSLTFSVLLACACGYDEDIGALLALNRVIVFFPLFPFGLLFKGRKLA